ncbi:MAG: F0F1 ATP synthase subunit gamma, partial [Ruminococcus sp.]|nr:F0F1 ATP synthase subunit gamma [Ruminococcus sp.]
KRQFTIEGKFPAVAEGLTIYQAEKLCECVIEPFLKGRIKSAELFYTEYVSPITQTARAMKILPVETEKPTGGKHALPIYEPSPAAVFNSIVPKYLTGVLFCAVVDSFASEQASRRSAMENASDNASEMIADLSLMYNRARQASITQEITEIVGGAAAD